MWHLLECREIECFSNFKYKFSIPKRKHRLSEVGLKEDDSLYFLVSLLYLRGGFPFTISWYEPNNDQNTLKPILETNSEMHLY
ncbi:hypothetical protein E1A91_D05G336600v1 [Gossypium mustelinum]|uniref:Uncharacterized protein n=1 Tax=Gossypium mustelinum TaxID=34275 RepID=A0A5D2V3Y5_GOSMU|nr:hypothetical protein E1A91_D05G336600v1 [Gossypium mustelinum]